MPKMLITQTCLGSPDGIQVKTYEAGIAYDLPADLAKNLEAAGWAKPVNETVFNKAAMPVPEDIVTMTYPEGAETKAAPAAPENKAGTPAPETKAKHKPAKGK